MCQINPLDIEFFNCTTFFQYKVFDKIYNIDFDNNLYFPFIQFCEKIKN